MNIVDMTALFVLMTTLALLPSTSVALVVLRSSSAGVFHGAAVTAGIVAGDLIFVFLAVFGMATLAELMGSLFLIIRYVAGAYLIWFGMSLLKSKRTSDVKDGGWPNPKLSASFLSGLFVTLGDVKAIFFYASLFPAFVDLANISASDVAIIVLLTIASVGGVKMGYVYFAGRVAFLATGLKAEKLIKITTGGCMVGTGVYLMAKPI